MLKYGDWGLGIGDWGLGIGRNPQSPIPILKIFFNILYRYLLFHYFLIKFKLIQYI